MRKLLTALLLLPTSALALVIEAPTVDIDANLAEQISVASQNGPVDVNATDGSITGSAALVTTGGITFNATQGIVLNSTANAFGGTVNATGAAATIVGSDAIDLGAFDTDNSLVVTAGGTISDSGPGITTDNLILESIGGGAIAIDNGFAVSSAVFSADEIVLGGDFSLLLGDSIVGAAILLLGDGFGSSPSRIDISGTLTLDFADPLSLANGDTFNIFGSTGALDLSGLDLALPILGPGVSIDTSRFLQEGSISIIAPIPVPAPAPAALLLAALMGCVSARRYRSAKG